MISVELDGPPVAWERPRIGRRGDGQGKAWAFQSPRTRAYEEALGYQARRAMRGRTPVTGPLALTVVAMLAIPKSWSKKKQAAALAGQERPTARPDWDNFGKVTDAFNGIVWVDDSQVVEAMVIKRYAERPCLRIEVEEIEHGEGLCAPGGDPA